VSEFSFFTTAELRGQGHTIRSVQREIEAGRLERVIKGWYATPRTDREAIRAMRMGGRLGCASALRVHGAWCPPLTGTHLQLPSHASGRRMARTAFPDDVTVHWHGKDDATGSAFPIAPVELAVPQMLACQPPHLAVAVLDSLLHRRLVSPNRLDALIAAGPHRMRFLAEHLEPRSEDGLESIIRFGLAMTGIATEIQVVLRSHDRLDLLVDDWLVLEADGRETHAVESAFTRDRVRAARLMRNGRQVVQFAYATVMYDFPFVVETVRTLIRQHGPVRRRARQQDDGWAAGRL
jgi:very-short-patch-repair endonuclease